MSLIVFADPVTTAPVGVASSREVLRLTWHGVDGSRWDLSSPQLGVGVLREDFVGLMHPAFVDYVTASPALDGQQYRSTRTMPRHVALHVLTHATTSTDFVARHRAWWQSWSPRQAGRLEVASVGGGVRSLWLRLQSSGDAASSRDPQQAARLGVPLEAVADAPHWLGQPISRSWSTGSPTEFYGASGFGPDFFISEASTVAGATVTNPGDEDTWPVWTVAATSALAGVSLSVGGGSLHLPDMAAGQVVRVDTDPATGGSQLGTLVGGVFVASDPDIDGLVDASDSRPLPPGVGTSVGITFTGDGSVTLEFVPRHWLAF